MTIYKFRGLDSEKKRLSQYTLDILTKGELFMSKPSTFNDIFDSRIVFQSAADKSIDDLKNYYESLSASYPNDPMFPEEQMEKLADTISDENRRKIICGKIDQMLQQANKNMDYYRIFCFSKEWDIPSMWGYYADNCKGIAIGFKTIEYQNSTCIEAEHHTLNTCPPSIFGKFNLCDRVYVPLVNIKYADAFPSKPDLIGRNTESIEDWITTKGTCWSHENEIRMLVCPLWMKILNPSKIVVYVKQYVINEIILGIGTPVEAVKQINDIVSDPYSKAFGATIYQLEPKTTQYGFDKKLLR